MLTINQYVKASSLEEAYELNQKRSNVVLGGMLWLKMQKRKKGMAATSCQAARRAARRWAEVRCSPARNSRARAAQKLL